MQPNKIMYIDLVDPLPKSYAPKKGEDMNRSTYSTMRYNKREDITHIAKINTYETDSNMKDLYLKKKKKKWTRKWLQLQCISF